VTSPSISTEIPLEGGEILGVHIGVDPHRTGLGRVRLIDFGVPLWALVAHLQSVEGNIEQTAIEYNVPVEAVRAAKAYYDAHPEYIDAFILLNRSAFNR
jgi:hypothetical protein